MGDRGGRDDDSDEIPMVGFPSLAKEPANVGHRQCVVGPELGPTPSLAAAEAEAETGAEVEMERWVADDFFVVLVQQVFDVGVDSDAWAESVPSAQIDARVARGVIVAEAEKIRVGAATYERSPQIPSPASSEIVQQQTAGVLR